MAQKSARLDIQWNKCARDIYPRFEERNRQGRKIIALLSIVFHSKTAVASATRLCCPGSKDGRDSQVLSKVTRNDQSKTKHRGAH